MKKTASDRAKELGCISIKQVQDATGQSYHTLRNWFKSNEKSKLFDVVCIGVAVSNNNSFFVINGKIINKSEIQK